MAIYGWAGGEGGGHGPCCQGTPPPASQPWLTAEGDTMGILVEGRAVAGPIGVHGLQGEQVLAPRPLGPVRWSRGAVHRGPAPACDSGAGPGLLWPRILGAAPSHVSRLGDVVLILHVCEDRGGWQTRVWMSPQVAERPCECGQTSPRPPPPPSGPRPARTDRHPCQFSLLTPPHLSHLRRLHHLSWVWSHSACQESRADS